MRPPLLMTSLTIALTGKAVRIGFFFFFSFSQCIFRLREMEPCNWCLCGGGWSGGGAMERLNEKWKKATQPHYVCSVTLCDTFFLHQAEDLYNISTLTKDEVYLLARIFSPHSLPLFIYFPSRFSLYQVAILFNLAVYGPVHLCWRTCSGRIIQELNFFLLLLLFFLGTKVVRFESTLRNQLPFINIQ